MHRLRRPKRPPPQKTDLTYARLWRILSGAVEDTFKHHEDYLTDKGRTAAIESISKRVVGAVLNFAEKSAQGRPGKQSCG